MNDPFRLLFCNRKKFDFVHAEEYCSFSIYFVRFLTKRSFIKIFRSINFFKISTKQLLVQKKLSFFQVRSTILNRSFLFRSFLKTNEILFVLKNDVP